MSDQRITCLRLLMAGIGFLAATSAEPASIGPDEVASVSAERSPIRAEPATNPSPAPVGTDMSTDKSDDGTAPSLEALIAEALARSPSVAALEARLAAALEMIRPAGALPDPMVEGMLQDIGFPRLTIGREDMSMAGIEVRQGLLFPGKRKARRAAARAEAATRGQELDQLQRGLVAQVRGLYARLYALDKEREALASAREMLEMLSSTVSTRYSAGNAELEAVVKTQLSLSRLGERLDDLTAARRVAVAALNRLLDRPGAEPLGEVKALPEHAPPIEPWEELALTNSPEVAVASSALAAAERRLQVARLELKPNLSAASGIASRGSLDRVVTLRLGMELPFWRGEKQKPLIRAAELEVKMAEEELRNAQATASSETARLSAEWQRAEAQIRRFRQAIVPQASVALDAARTSYQNGRGDFSTVVEDYNLWLDARVELARREADRFATWAEIEALTAPLSGAMDKGDAR